MNGQDRYWVQAAPFRALLGRLIDLTGLPLPVLAEHAKVPPMLAQHLLHGRQGRRLARIPSEAARRLLALDETQLQAFARLRYH